MTDKALSGPGTFPEAHSVGPLLWPPFAGVHPRGSALPCLLGFKRVWPVVGQEWRWRKRQARGGVEES